MEFKDFLKEIRHKSGLSQYKFAEELKYSQALIGSFEAGTRNPSYDFLKALKAFCKQRKIKISFDDIFNK